MPSYKIRIDGSIINAIQALENAAGIINASLSYTDAENPYHAEAVADYNKITSAILAMCEIYETIIA